MCEDELRLKRYLLTDLLDDLVAERSPRIRAAIVAELWARAGEVLLASRQRWVGGGKWLMREIESWDAEAGTCFAERFDRALTDGIAGHIDPLVRLVDDVLEPLGSRLRDGFYLAASLP